MHRLIVLQEEGREGRRHGTGSGVLIRITLGCLIRLQVSWSKDIVSVLSCWYGDLY